MSIKKYKPILVGAGATVKFDSSYVGGFLCTTGGSITITRNNQDGTTTTLLTAFAVVATGGLNFIEIPMFIGYNGGTITSTAAVGVLLA
jgi:hypothetical protein